MPQVTPHQTITIFNLQYGRVTTIEYCKVGNLASIIFGESVRGKIFGNINFREDLPAGLALRLGSCTYIMYRYMPACATSKALVIVQTGNPYSDSPNCQN